MIWNADLADFESGLAQRFMDGVPDSGSQHLERSFGITVEQD